MNILRVNGCRFFQYSRPGISSCSELTLMIQLKYGQSQVLCSVLEASLLEKLWWQDLPAVGFLLLDSSSHPPLPLCLFHSWQINSSTPFHHPVICHIQPSQSFNPAPVLSAWEFLSSRGTFILFNIINYYKHHGDLYFF